jgi:2,4-dienoyl-CoA reductase-like NADH-dependent reductase (Old Yellow Enzyme family)/thioredoxin reductase
MQFPKLFSPIKVGSLELSNRFVVPPMGFDLTNEVANGGGIVNQAVIDYWVARARGGWGLLIFEFTAIDPLGKAGPRHIGIWNDAFVAGFKQLTEAVHKYGARIAIQLGHAGRQTTEKIIGAQPVSASPIACPVARETPRELASEEVYELVEKFGDAAVRARDAGFDAVEIHGAHGYLIAQFMSAYTNKRIDEFGGSFHNRMKFPVEIIRNVRRKIGSSFPLLFRISGEEKVPGGRTIDETRAAARMLVEEGIDAIDVSVSVNVTGKYIIAPAVLPPGFLLSSGEEIKKAVSVPVISVGRINHPMYAEDAIETGKADLIAWGRSSLADPELPNKVAAGQLDDICPCIACLQGCARLLELHDDPLAELKVTCLVNPFCARESEMRIKPAAKSKKVVIVGGGPGGLEAAWVAAACGHQVTLYEKQRALGGQFRIAAIPPFKQEIARAIAYYIHMCQKYGVSLKTGVTATVAQILAEKPDVVIVATGGEPFIPDIEGVSGARVVTAWDILEGKQPAGNRVLMVGGGMVGCEVADFLGEHLHDVTLMEMLLEIAQDVPLYVRDFLMQRLRDYSVKIETGTSVVKFLDNGVIVNKDGNESRLEGFDTIVLALGAKSVNDLEEQLADKVPELYVIGDALAPRQAIDAIEEGARVALKL